MSRRIVCPSCSTEFIVRGALRENKIKCPGCAVIIRIAEEAPASRYAEEEEDEEIRETRPRRRRAPSRSQEGMPAVYKWILGSAVCAGSLIVTIYALQTLGRDPDSDPPRQVNAPPVVRNDERRPDPKPPEPERKPTEPAKFVKFESRPNNFSIEFPEMSRSDDAAVADGVHIRRRCNDGTGYEVLCVRTMEGELSGPAPESLAYVRGYVQGTIMRQGWEFKEPCKDSLFQARPAVIAYADDSVSYRKIIGFAIQDKVYVLASYHDKQKELPEESKKFFDSFRPL